MRNYTPGQTSPEPEEFDPFAAPPPSVPNLRLQRKKLRDRRIRMALCIVLPVAFVLVLSLGFEVEWSLSIILTIALFHAVMGFADMLLADIAPPNPVNDAEDPRAVDKYARWFGFRDW